MNYDIVGDIHGHSEALETLLADLGYVHRNGAFRHPDRHMVFLGDLVDRGPNQIDAVRTAREMQEAGTGTVCMGNHEFNAIGFQTLAACGTRHLRNRDERNTHQHRVFLDAVGLDTPVHREHAEWFKTLPLWVEFPGFRAVHACWHPAKMAALAGSLDGANRLTEDSLHAMFTKGTAAYDAAEVVLKGLEIPLPEGVLLIDSEGTKRTKTRIRWWDETSADFRSSSIVDEETASRIPDDPLPPESRLTYDEAKPVFFGHYWMQGEPRLMAPRKACLDFSVAKDGYLVAYRWDGEDVLDPSRLVSVRPNYAPSPGA